MMSDRTATRALGEHLPSWLLVLFATAILLVVALDLVASWGPHDLASRPKLFLGGKGGG